MRKGKEEYLVLIREKKGTRHEEGVKWAPGVKGKKSTWCEEGEKRHQV